MNGRPALAISALPRLGRRRRSGSRPAGSRRAGSRSGSAGRAGAGTPSSAPAVRCARATAGRARPRSGWPAQQRDPDAAGQREAGAGLDAEVGPAVVGPAQLDDPAAVVERRRPVQRHGHAVRPSGREPAGQGGRGVDHDQVAGLEQVRQVAEPQCGSPARRDGQQPHLVAGQAARFGRRGGLGAGREGERRHRARRRRRPGRRRGNGRWAGRPSISASSAGTTGSGAGPVADVLAREGGLVHVGGACRRGRRRSTRSSGCSTARTAVELVERGLAGAVAAPARVGLDGGVGADVHDRAAGRCAAPGGRPAPARAVRRR